MPDDVRRALKARAAAQGESLNAYLLGLIERDVARPDARLARSSGNLVQVEVR